ncbi:MAG: DUF1330 domain-containing protein [Pseudomonadales bacterium]
MNPLRTLLVWLLAAFTFGCDSDVANHLPGIDPWLDGNPGEFAKFATDADQGPVVMINLLKFREHSLDGDGTGAEAYARYGELASPFVAAHGGKLLWLGEAQEHLVGDTNYDWDSVLLVSWPTRQNLLDLGNDEGYQAIAHHRMNGLERTMLIALDEQVNAFAPE